MRNVYVVASICIAGLLGGCSSAHQLFTPTNNVGPRGVGHEVLQNGTVPVNWTQFTPSTPSGNYYGMVVGPDKNMWFLDAGDSSLMKMTMAGSTTSFPLSGFAGNAMTVGADKKFYIVADTGSKVDVVTQTGVVKARSIPSGDTTFEGGISKGPDGNVWFVEQAHIGKITPAGVITEYAYPDGNLANKYHGIAVGADNNLWFTEEDPNTTLPQIGRIVPATGAITFFAAPPGCVPTGIAPGTGPILWFTCGGSLGSITTTGTVTAYPEFWQDPHLPMNIIKGPDGNPWWISQTNDVIGEFNPTNNTYTGYLPPYSTDSPTSLNLGPDGNIWTTTTNKHINVYIIKVLSVSPSTLTFPDTGQTQTITGTETGNPKLTATSSQNSVATVAAGAQKNTFKVKSIGPGTAKITVTDGQGNSFNVPVTVFNGIWATKASMPTARQYLAAGVVNGILYAVGGWDGSSVLQTVEAYDPSTDTWTTKAPMPTARYYLGVGVVNGILYAVGGNNNGTKNAWVNTVEAYDPSTNSWTTKANMPTARNSLAVGVVNGILYAVGGNAGAPVNTVEAYDPSTDMWASKASMPTMRYALGAGVINGVVYAVGGANSPTLNTNEAYNPLTDMWATKAPMPTARYVLAAGVVNSVIYAVGGSNTSGVLDVNEAYDPSTDGWTTKAHMPTARANLAAGVVGGTLYAIGGNTSSGIVNTVESFTP